VEEDVPSLEAPVLGVAIRDGVMGMARMEECSLLAVFDEAATVRNETKGTMPSIKHKGWPESQDQPIP
jgi:hypothetical protein